MKTERSRDMVVLLGLAALCIAVYGRCVTFEHTLYDDPNIIFENTHVMEGLTWDSIKWAILNPNFGLYMPLPTLTFMLDKNLFGDWAGGYHAMTLLWHILCVLTFYLVMRRLTGNFAAVLAAAVLAAVHPVQAMTVNWISARNEIMPAFFMLLSLDMYFRMQGGNKGAGAVTGNVRHKMGWMALSLLFLFLGIMSKQGIVLLPAVFLLLDYWPLGRIDLNPAAPLKTLGRMSVLILEKLPWFALSGVGAAFAIYGKRDFGMIQESTLLTPLDNIGFAFTAYARYLFHLVYPERYIMAYAVDPEGPSWWMIGISVALLAGLTAGAATQIWKRPWIPVFWGWFVLFLLPTSGLVRYAVESIALRYLYTPGMGIYLLAGFGLYGAAAWYSKRSPLPQAPPSGKKKAPLSAPVDGTPRLFWIALVALAVVSCTLSFRQSGFWRDAETLAKRALAVTNGENALAHNHLSVLCDRKGMTQQAFAHAKKAIELEPHRNVWKTNYAITLNRQQRYEETLKLMEPLLREQPDKIVYLNLYGGALTGLARFEEAMPLLEKALELEPRFVPARYNLGLCLQHLGRTDEAREQYQKVLELQPTHQSARASLEALKQTGK